MPAIETLDQFTSAPDKLKQIFKYYRKSGQDDLASDPDIVDTAGLVDASRDGWTFLTSAPSASDIDKACTLLESTPAMAAGSSQTHCPSRIGYELKELPGLRIYPKLISPRAQVNLLSDLLHNSLADERNNTNVHAHHVLPYHAIQPTMPGRSTKTFFNLSPSSKTLFQPRDLTQHASFCIPQFLNTKLRWMTLGAQYDWTKKCYPKAATNVFPYKISQCIQTLFPDVRPEAGIMNVYSPSDSLSMHRDVSEECDKPLVSISLGCDCIFIVGRHSGAIDQIEPHHQVLRLHSGDVLYLEGASRFAWHGVPQVLANTCPQWLGDWPHHHEDNGIAQEEYHAWTGWMANKRVNLSVRQVVD